MTLTLREAEEHLLGLELFGMRFGLDRMHRLMTVLGLPQHRFASVHVVGSNGKSSTARMIAALLQAHGLASGSYTSPHLRSFVERIELNGRPIAEGHFAEAVSEAVHAAELVDRSGDDPVTQFEALTAAAYQALARARVEVAVVEAGLGGRYDATNVIPSRVQVLTSVGLEHTRWLGPTIADIAGEKLAVVRDHACLVVPDAGLDPEAEDAIASVIAERHARLVRAPLDPGVELPNAPGGFQRRNFALALAAAEAFLGALDPAAVHEAAATVRVPGRLEVVGERPLVIHDVAHNPAGAGALAQSLPELLGGRPLTAVLAILDDKDAAGILGELLPLCERAVFTRSANPRSLSPATLESLAAKLGGPPCETVADPHEAVARARTLAGPDGAVLAAGSVYLIADLVRPAGSASRASAL